MIEPNILERSKEIVTKIPEIEHIHLEDRINVWGQNDLDNPSVVSMSAKSLTLRVQVRMKRYKVDLKDHHYINYQVLLMQKIKIILNSHIMKIQLVSTGVLKIFEEAVQPFITIFKTT